MDVAFYLAGKMKFKGKLAMWSIALSFLVMIVSISVSEGFRSEIRTARSEASGDIHIEPLNIGRDGIAATLNADPDYLAAVSAVEGVESVQPVVYKGAMVKHNGQVHGFVMKGVEGMNADSSQLSVSLPAALASMMGLKIGDRMLTYFVEDQVKVRKFKVVDIYESALASEDYLVAYADIGDLQRLSGPDGASRVSAFELKVAPGFQGRKALEEKTLEISDILARHSSEKDDTAVARHIYNRFPSMMDWLDLIDFNVLFILGLMVGVASFNMISGLLIILFENISTIGLLKALGMKTKAIMRIFLYGSGKIVLKGMLIGNAAALAFCLFQQWTGVLKLDPANYFLSAVPVHLEFGALLAWDALAAVVIMVVLLLPSLFISRVDPAQTMRVN